MRTPIVSIMLMAGSIVEVCFCTRWAMNTAAIIAPMKTMFDAHRSTFSLRVVGCVFAIVTNVILSRKQKTPDAN